MICEQLGEHCIVKQDCLFIEVKSHANRTHRQAFCSYEWVTLTLTLTRWPWYTNLISLPRSPVITFRTLNTFTPSRETPGHLPNSLSTDCHCLLPPKRGIHLSGQLRSTKTYPAFYANTSHLKRLKWLFGIGMHACHGCVCVGLIQPRGC